MYQDQTQGDILLLRETDEVGNLKIPRSTASVRLWKWQWVQCQRKMSLVEEMKDIRLLRQVRQQHHFDSIPQRISISKFLHVLSVLLLSNGYFQLLRLP